MTRRSLADAYLSSGLEVPDPIVVSQPGAVVGAGPTRGNGDGTHVPEQAIVAKWLPAPPRGGSHAHSSSGPTRSSPFDDRRMGAAGTTYRLPRRDSDRVERCAGAHVDRERRLGACHDGVDGYPPHL